MNKRCYILFLAFILCSCSAASYGQGAKTISIKDVSGVSKNGDGYKIVGNVDLKGKTLIIPKGTKLEFDGGKITNGTVIFNENHLLGDVSIEGDMQGTITNDEIKTSWFGLNAGSKVDQTKTLQNIINLFQSNVSSNSWDINPKNPEPTIVIPSGQYNIGEVELRSYLTIKGSGRGSTILKGASFKANGQYNITIEDLSIIGYVNATKQANYKLDNIKHSSAFKLNDCARLVFNNICIKNYDVAFDNYNTYLVDLYSCFISYCHVCYMNDGKGNGYGGHAIRWFGGEMCNSVYGFVQRNGHTVLINGSTIESCRYGFFLQNPGSFTINACGFEANNYDIYGTVTHINIENNHFSKSGKKEGDVFIYAPTAIGFAVIQGNAFDLPVFDAPHILIDNETKIYGNIMIGQNDIVHGGRIPVSEKLLPYVMEKGVNTYQTYLPDGNNMIMGQTIVYKNPKTGKHYLVTRDNDGKLLFLPFSYQQ